MIWQAVANEFKVKEQQEILRKRISLQRISPSLDKSIDQSIETIQKMLSTSVLNKDKRASLASQCSKTVTQYKYDLMMLTLATTENIIRGHARMAMDLKEKLLLIDNANLQLSREELLQTIKHREEIMKKRFETMVQYKVNTFFDEAPMASSE
jgi:hypothetical protein